MKDYRFFPFSDLTRALVGYTLIIALTLIIFREKGHEFAVRLANGIVPLAFFALGGALLDLLDFIFSIIFSKLRKSNQKEAE